MSQETQQETASANRPIGKITQIAAAVGRAARQPAGGSVRAVLALLIGFFALGAFMGAALVSDKESVPATIGQQTAVIPAASTPDPAWTSPIKQISGVTYDHSGTTKSYGLTYECESGLAPVQLSAGQTVQTDGTMFSLKETRSSSWGAQGVLTLSVKLNANTAVRGIIVTPAAHVKHPGLYNEYRIDADFGFGTTATQEFKPDTYSQNYENLGINTLTLCTQKMKK